MQNYDGLCVLTAAFRVRFRVSFVLTTRFGFKGAHVCVSYVCVCALWFAMTIYCRILIFAVRMIDSAVEVIAR